MTTIQTTIEGRAMMAGSHAAPYHMPSAQRTIRILKGAGDFSYRSPRTLVKVRPRRG